QFRLAVIKLLQTKICISKIVGFKNIVSVTRNTWVKRQRKLKITKNQIIVTNYNTQPNFTVHIFGNKSVVVIAHKSYGSTKKRTESKAQPLVRSIRLNLKV